MKKGFTLIELLAVIIILAILMIIAVPNILTTLATARSQAFITQAQSLHKTAEQQYVISAMTGNPITCFDGTDTSSQENGVNRKLDISGGSIDYYVKLNTSGQVTMLQAYDSSQKLYISAGSDAANATTLAQTAIAGSNNANLHVNVASKPNGTTPTGLTAMKTCA